MGLLDLLKMNTHNEIKDAPYPINQSEEDYLVNRYVKKELGRKYIKSPGFGNKLDDWDSSSPIAPAEHFKRWIFEANPSFWVGKKFLDLGCCHDIVPKILQDITGGDFSYDGVDCDPMTYKYPQDTKDKENIRFHRRDINGFKEGDFEGVDMLLYFGLSPINLEITKSFLNKKGFLLRSTSLYSFKAEYKKEEMKIKKNDFKLRQQIWSYAKLRFLEEHSDNPKEMEYVSGTLMYQLEDFLVSKP